MRLKLVPIANSLIEGTLQQGNIGTAFYVDNGLPAGAKLQSVVVGSHTTTLAFEHESFPDTPPNEAYPHLVPCFYAHHWEGPFSLWSCNGCDWRGYLIHTRTGESEPADHLCPECGDPCDMITNVDLRRMVEVGLHYTAGTAISEETAAWLASEYGKAMRPIGDGLTLADVLEGKRIT